MTDLLKALPWRRVLSHAAPALVLLINDLTNAVKSINSPTVVAVVTGVGALIISALHNAQRASPAPAD